MDEYGKRSLLKVPGTILFGTGTVEELGKLSGEYGTKAVLVTGGTSIRQSGNFDRICAALRRSDIDVQTVEGVTHDPDELLVDGIVEKIRSIGPDVIIGAGGGSVIDTAKAASIIVVNGGAVRDYWEGKSFTECSIPYIALPTTSGTGAEITKNAVISEKNGLFKKSIRSEYMIPNCAIIDPSLTLSVPPEVTVDTGLDALIQNLEAYTSKNSGPITDTLASKAIGLAIEYLPAAYRNPSDLRAREALSLASLYGGITLANAGLGLAHGLSHPLGIGFGVPHGRACAVFMPKVIEYNYPARKERYGELARLLDRGDDPASAFKRFAEELGVSTRLGDYGVKAEDIPGIVENSRGGSRNFNPVDHDDETVEKMLVEML